ncbi:MAG: UvrB/UvrC motif-containing protein [Acutalibacteraceae bacterium]
MMCQHCGKHPATTHLKRTVNGQTTELYVCAECAAKQGMDLFGGFGWNMGNLFGGFFNEPFLRESGETVRCESCGRSFREIAESGQVGCPDCYTTFYDRLQPSIQRIHGKTVHAGKIACGASDAGRAQRELEQLKEELNKAVALQEYEKCAQLRDRIKELEGEEHE